MKGVARGERRPSHFVNAPLCTAFAPFSVRGVLSNQLDEHQHARRNVMLYGRANRRGFAWIRTVLYKLDIDRRIVVLVGFRENFSLSPCIEPSDPAIDLPGGRRR